VSDFIREIDEDLRRENLEKLWRKYGGYALVLAVAVVLAIAAYTGWQRYSESQRAERARQYESALQLVASGDAKASEELAALAADDGDGYAALARLQAAALKAKAGDSAGAVVLYEQLAADGAVDGHLRDLALILLALQTADTAAPDALTKRLQPLTEAGNPWRYSALEITAVLAHRTGDKAKAQEILTGLADDLDAPPALRQRATEMLAALKG
jgi:hypothetical protein